MTEAAVLTRISRNPAKFADYTICHAEKLSGCEALPLVMKGQAELFEEVLCELNNMVYDHHSVIYMKVKDTVIGVLTYFFVEEYSPKKLMVVLGYVEKEYRGKGIMNFLVREIKKVAVINQCGIIEFDTAVKNRRMQRLVMKMGCVPIAVKYRFIIEYN